jgi:hypothetical protein
VRGDSIVPTETLFPAGWDAQSILEDAAGWDEDDWRHEWYKLLWQDVETVSGGIWCMYPEYAADEVYSDSDLYSGMDTSDEEDEEDEEEDEVEDDGEEYDVKEVIGDSAFQDH